jgi:hypothetical protein
MLTQKRVTLSLVALATMAGNAAAQGLNESSGARLFYQVFDAASNSWTTSINVAPGARVEWRAVVSYTGTNTNVSALGGIVYQPTLSSIDNDENVGTLDTLAPWRAASSPQIPIEPVSPVLSPEEGQTGGPLGSYGRVAFGGTVMTASSGNAMTTFRHTSGSAGAPAGSWLRVAGSFVTSWPLAALPTAADATATNLNNINRGVASTQQAAVNVLTGQANTFHIAGTQNLVIFRGALLLSDQASPRVIELATAAGTQQRVGGFNNADDARFMSWQTSATDNGSWRVGVTLESASINVIPTPATSSLLAALALVATRRRRS